MTATALLVDGPLAGQFLEVPDPQGLPLSALTVDGVRYTREAVWTAQRVDDRWWEYSHTHLLHHRRDRTP